MIRTIRGEDGGRCRCVAASFSPGAVGFKGAIQLVVSRNAAPRREFRLTETFFCHTPEISIVQGRRRTDVDLTLVRVWAEGFAAYRSASANNHTINASVKTFRIIIASLSLDWIIKALRKKGDSADEPNGKIPFPFFQRPSADTRKLSLSGTYSPRTDNGRHRCRIRACTIAHVGKRGRKEGTERSYEQEFRHNNPSVSLAWLHCKFHSMPRVSQPAFRSLARSRCVRKLIIVRASVNE